MKIITIIGARPQFVKAAVVSRAIAKYSNITEVIIHTGQHYDTDMSDIFFTELSIPKPNYNLNINGLSHGAMTGQMLEKIESILLEENPNWVLVYGDTNSTIAGALAAKKLHIKVAHVESGLRSYNIGMPEEINRILTDRISNMLFCPTENAVQNLIKEGYRNIDCKIVNSGDVMFDASVFYSNKAVKPNINITSNFILCTIHRAENTDNLDKLKSIFKALEEIALECNIVLPLHPRTKLKLKSINFNFEKSKILFTPPLSFFEIIYLLQNCKLVMTDSGGLQKEAYFFNKHCVTLREETEWVELVEYNYNILSGSDYSKIIRSFEEIKQIKLKNFNNNFYGDANAGEIIVKSLINN